MTPWVPWSETAASEAVAVEHLGEAPRACYPSPVPEADEAQGDLDAIRLAVSGDRAAARSIVTRLLPGVQRAVIRVLGGRARSAQHRQEVEDLAQDVFVALFANGGRELLRWDPQRGMTLEGFVSLVARRFVISRLRVRRLEAAQLGTSEPPDAASIHSAAPDAAFSAREELQTLSELLRANLSPLGLAMFQRLFVLEQSVELICRDCDMTVDAIYQWRKRLKDTIGELREQMAAPVPSGCLRRA